MSETLSILIPLDLTEEASQLKMSLDRFLNQKLEPILLHVIDQEIIESLTKAELSGTTEIVKKLKTNSEDILKDLASNFGENAQVIVVEGSPFIEIIKLARDLKVDLIAMPAHSKRQNLQELFFGSTTERVIRGSTVPVFCLR